MTAARPRTYNQDHVARPYVNGKRRISIYWTWSYAWESNRDVASMDNRFSTMTEVRRVAWPTYEGCGWGPDNFLQGIAGTLELFHRSTLDFQRVAESVTGQAVAIYQRVDQAGFPLPIDERILADTDTLMVFGLDHLPSNQVASAEEISAIKKWLEREGTCLLIAPHHDVGFTDDLDQRQVEYLHHGDRLVPRQQRFGTYTRTLMKALEVPVHNEYGLRPAVIKGTRDPVPLSKAEDLDKPGLLRGVSNFSFHMHLPQYRVTDESSGVIYVLARQPIDADRPHPWSAAGNSEINALLWMPPGGRRGGQIVLVDSTHFTTLFGGTESLKAFWRNLAAMK
jgi:hypothetical protein